MWPDREARDPPLEEEGAAAEAEGFVGAVETTVPPELFALGSHSFTSESFAPDATRPSVACQSTALASPPWPASVTSEAQRAKSQMRTVASSDAVANFRSVGAKATALTGSRCAWIAFTSSKFGLQYLTAPASSQLTIQLSLCEKRAARIGLSCACKMVAKPNVAPFQSVNSPPAVAERQRRPSGVQTTALTEQRALLTDMCTNLVAAAAAGAER